MTKRVVNLAVLSAMLLFFAACASNNGSPPPVRVDTSHLPATAEAAAQSSDPVSDAILTAVNGARASAGVAPLSANGQLQHSAATHAADMVQRNFVGNFNPEGQGATERMLVLNPDFKGGVDENIAVLDVPAAAEPAQIAGQALKLWLKNPDQRKVLRSPNYTQTGVGLARKGTELYIVQDFIGP